MRQHRIYLASSWRNEQHQTVVAALRALGHEVYDFKNPGNGKPGFSWKQVGYDTDFIKNGDVAPEDIAIYLGALKKPRAVEGFNADHDAMLWATAFVLLLPCGRSAHLEAGWAAGAGIPTHVVLSTDKFEPELMYLLCDYIHPNIDMFLGAMRIQSQERAS